VSINSHGFIASSSQEAADDSYPSTALMMNRIGAERGWPPLGRRDFEAQRTIHGALFTGSPAEVAEKILLQHELFGHSRFLLQLSVGTLPHAKVLRAIELFGTEVAPVVRAELRRRADGAAPSTGA
jgi:alkanesulfonate monooxygenase SsuD/methylene tetrahydromethanopterin reductase-like flavin-dependent oxidoreductase (luciferase family)